MAQAEIGKKYGVVDRIFGRKPELSPEKKWVEAFDTQMKIDPQNVLRFDIGRNTHATLQVYDGLRMAHLDKGDPHAGRLTVAVSNTGEAYVVRSIPNEIPKPTSHTWEVLDAAPTEINNHLKRNASDIAHARLHDTRNTWNGIGVENDRIAAVIADFRRNQ